MLIPALLQSPALRPPLQSLPGVRPHPGSSSQHLLKAHRQQLDTNYFTYSAIIYRAPITVRTIAFTLSHLSNKAAVLPRQDRGGECTLPSQRCGRCLNQAATCPAAMVANSSNDVPQTTCEELPLSHPPRPGPGQGVEPKQSLTVSCPQRLHVFTSCLALNETIVETGEVSFYRCVPANTWRRNAAH